VRIVHNSDALLHSFTNIRIEREHSGASFLLFLNLIKSLVMFFQAWLRLSSTAVLARLGSS